MNWKRQKDVRVSNTLLTILTGAAVLGVLLFVRELPALRRYIRIERM